MEINYEYKIKVLTYIKNLCKEINVIFDLKNLLNSNQVDLKL